VVKNGFMVSHLDGAVEVQSCALRFATRHCDLQAGRGASWLFSPFVGGGFGAGVAVSVEQWGVVLVRTDFSTTFKGLICYVKGGFLVCQGVIFLTPWLTE